MTQNTTKRINDCGLGDLDRKQIARTLRPLRDGVDLEEVLTRIETARHHSLVNRAYEKTRQPQKQIKHELHQVALCATALRSAIDSLSQDAHGNLKALLRVAEHNQDATEHRTGFSLNQLPRHGKHVGPVKPVSLLELGEHIALLGSAAKNFQPRGRPREVALYQYAFELVFVFTYAMGSKPRRRYKDRRLPFFDACMVAAGVDEYPSRIIRQAIEDFAKLFEGIRAEDLAKFDQGMIRKIPLSARV